MTYAASETSAQDGAPVELYEFNRGSVYWRYTSAEADQVIDAVTWTSTFLVRPDIELSTEAARNNLEIDAPRDLAVAELFRVTPPTDVIGFTLYRYHRADSSAQIVAWQGRVLNVNWSDTSKATLICEPVSTSARRVMNRRLQTRGCTHSLYTPRPGCGVLKADHKIDTTVTAIDGYDLTVAALLSRPYAGGFVERVDGDGNIDRRFIRSYSGLVLTLAIPFQDLAVTDAVTVYPGCDQTPTTCSTVFNNYANFGGLPHFAQKNPFNGDPLY